MNYEAIVNYIDRLIKPRYTGNLQVLNLFNSTIFC